MHTSNAPTIQPSKTPMNPLWILGGCIAVALLLWLFYGFFASNEEGITNQANALPIPTTAEFSKMAIAKMNEFLNNPENSDNYYFQFVKDAHLTVTPTGGSVKSCRIETFDGSDLVGHDAENISRVYFVVTVSWDGTIQRGGYSDVEAVLDLQQGKILGTQIVATNAKVDVNNPDFWKRAGEIGVGIGGPLLLDWLFSE